MGVWLLGNLTSSYTSAAKDSTCAAPEVVRTLLTLLTTQVKLLYVCWLLDW